MPRISHNLIRKAWNTSRYLPPILSVTRDLPSAISELRWLTEYVVKTSRPDTSPLKQHKRLLKLVKRRAKCEPLQYILGSQPFGALDIRCRKGVLIPRPESEAYVQHIVDLYKTGELHHAIKRNEEDWKAHELADREGTPPPEYSVSPLRILDACAGTGSIGISLLHGILPLFPYTLMNGIDNSYKAVSLARENRQRNIHKFSQGAKEVMFRCRFHQHDVFNEFPLNQRMFDIIVSNPPYISPAKFRSETERSVRIWEPKSALVPLIPSDCSILRSRPDANKITKFTPAPQDIFYERLLQLHENTFNKVLVMEVGDAAQAIRVLTMALNKPRSDMHMRAFKDFNKFEIWRDHPSEPPQPGAVEWISIGVDNIPIKGAGKVRCVVVHRTYNWQPEPKVDYFTKQYQWDASTARLQRIIPARKPTRRAKLRKQRAEERRAKDLEYGPRLATHLGETQEMREERNQAGRMGQKGWGGGRAEMSFAEWREKGQKQKSAQKNMDPWDVKTVARLKGAYGGAEDAEYGGQSSERGMSPRTLKSAAASRKRTAEGLTQELKKNLRRKLDELEKDG